MKKKRDIKTARGRLQRMVRPRRTTRTRRGFCREAYYYNASWPWKSVFLYQRGKALLLLLGKGSVELEKCIKRGKLDSTLFAKFRVYPLFIDAGLCDPARLSQKLDKRPHRILVRIGVHGSNENKMSCRERGRASLREKGT